MGHRWTDPPRQPTPQKPAGCIVVILACVGAATTVTARAKGLI